ncbi:MAG: sensor histidine kinase, partial [Longimicrobiales bacterium]
RAGLVASVTTDDLESRLDSRIEIACFRVVQEACTNIVRHARALTVGVELRRDASSLELTVRDDGVGFDVAGSRYRASLGLLGMEERVTLAGGRLEIESTPGQGTLVRARFP